jgi:hypothetical protein
MEQYLTPGEVARRLRLNDYTVRRWIGIARLCDGCTVCQLEKGAALSHVAGLEGVVPHDETSTVTEPAAADCDGVAHQIPPNARLILP